MSFFFSQQRAINYENDQANNVKNQLTGDYGAVPDTARHYKVCESMCILFLFFVASVH